MDSAIKKTIQTYEKLAFDYYKTHSNVSRIKNLLDFFIQNLKGKRVLDIGCGPGRDAKYFSKKGLKVVGIDIAPTFIRIASKDVPKAKFIKMDMMDLDLPFNSFDGIWIHASFPHIPKKDALRTLCTLKKILDIHGILYISIKIGEGEKFDGKRFFSLYTEDEFKNLLESCNFQILKISKSDKKGEKWLYIFCNKNG